jgi:hypothetical protein
LFVEPNSGADAAVCRALLSDTTECCSLTIK